MTKETQFCGWAIILLQINIKTNKLPFLSLPLQKASENCHKTNSWDLWDVIVGIITSVQQRLSSWQTSYKAFEEHSWRTARPSEFLCTKGWNKRSKVCLQNDGSRTLDGLLSFFKESFSILNCHQCAKLFNKTWITWSRI